MEEGNLQVTSLSSQEDSLLLGASSSLISFLIAGTDALSCWKQITKFQNG
jgi:hypothetical protein